MNDYKRLTAHKLTSFYDWERENLKPEQIAEMYDRLAELEDKIENKTLVELPCKVGDTVYQFDNAGNIYESKIKQLIYDTGHISFDERAIGTSIFLTKAEAEARLKELDNSYKETGEF